MNLQQLGYFVAVARSRSFTRAAEACFVAQPALSQQVRKLEDELGLPVFDRRNRGVSLTVAGIAFLAYAEQALQLVAEGKQRVTDLRDMRCGLVTLMCLPTVATYWLPRAVSLFRQCHSDVEIQIQERTGCTPKDFRDSAADFGIVQLPEESEPGEPTIKIERLFVDEQVLVLPKNHRLVADEATANEGLCLKSVADEPFVLPKASCGMTRTISRAFSEAGIRPRVRLETSQIEAVYEMVAAGLGIGLLPSMAMHRSRQDVIWRRIKPPAPKRTIVLATPSATSLSPAAAAFVQIARRIAFESKQSLGIDAPTRRRSRKSPSTSREVTDPSLTMA